MSEQPYSVFENQDGKAIVCGKRPVLFEFTGLDTIANVLNQEIAPMIAALEEKALENMQLHERIAELEAALEEVHEYIVGMKHYADSYPVGGAEFEALALKLKEVLAKKAGVE